MTDASAYNAIPRAIRSLYEPQLEQFGIIVRRNGEGWSGTGRSTWGRGSIWGMPVGDFCIAFSHEVYMEHDMTLVESPESAYACVCMVSEDSKATMPRMIDRPRALLDGSLYSFVQPAGSFSGTLHRGGLIRRAASAFCRSISRSSIGAGRARSRACSSGSGARGTRRNRASSCRRCWGPGRNTGQVRRCSSRRASSRWWRRWPHHAPAMTPRVAALRRASGQGLPSRRKPPSSACSTRGARPAWTNLRACCS